MNVPYFRPDLSEDEIREVVDTLRSGWLTTGPRVKRFEAELSAMVRAKHAVAVNSATAALHLATDALGLARDQGVLVPAMTFAATAEVVRYAGAHPILVDCDPVTQNMDLGDAEAKLAALAAGRLPIPNGTKVTGIIPVHVGGAMMDMGAVARFAQRHQLWVVEDAAHALPAARRPGASSPWRFCGEGTSQVACFSFYANKTITTGEGGMAVTDDPALADRMRLMSLHGLSHDAWQRYAGGRAWDYRIVAPGYKYNLTDVAAAIGIHQLARAEAMRAGRERVALRYLEAFSDRTYFDLPPADPDLLHAWHLFPIRLRLDRLTIDRNRFIDLLKDAGIGCSVHWRPLHAHPYYAELGWKAEHAPVADREWLRLVSLPIFSAITDAEQSRVIEVVLSIASSHGR
jgi:perosamine synthetase